jgi:hypothetical protein
VNGIAPEGHVKRRRGPLCHLGADVAVDVDREARRSVPQHGADDRDVDTLFQQHRGDAVAAPTRPHLGSRSPRRSSAPSTGPRSTAKAYVYATNAGGSSPTTPTTSSLRFAHANRL